MALRRVLSFSVPRTVHKDIYFADSTKLKDGDVLLEDKFVLEKGYIFKNFSFPLGVSVLYIIGLITGVLVWERQRAALIIASFLTLLAAVSSTVIIFLAHYPILSYFASFRSLIYGDRILIPIIAAYGAYGIFALLLLPLKLLKRQPHIAIRVSKSIILSLLAFTFGLSMLYFFRDKPNIMPNRIAYGAGFDLRNILHDTTRADNVCGLPENAAKPRCTDQLLNTHFNVNALLTQCQEYEVKGYGTASDKTPVCTETFTPQDIHAFIKTCDSDADIHVKETICKARQHVRSVVFSDLSPSTVIAKIRKDFPLKDFYIHPTQKEILDLIPDDQFIRYDYSPNMAAGSMIGPYIKITPQLNTYVQFASLIGRMVGYEISNLYTEDPVYADSAALPQIAQWFGIQYLVVHGAADPLEKLEEAGFRKHKHDLVYKAPQSEPIFSVNTKPTVLVVGQEGQYRIFDEVFKRSNFGLFHYDEVVLVKGKEQIDDHSLQELQNFDLVFLHGYTYGNRTKAWNLLQAYIEQGGSVFIDTGWQYTVKDWDVGNTAEFFPTTTLRWTDFGKANNYVLHNNLFETNKIDSTQFEPLIWNDVPWGVSSGDDLREWAKPILTVDNHPLIAGGEFGNGKVVWSGMNSLGHIPEYNSKHAEMQLLNALMKWLLPDASSQTFIPHEEVMAMRDHPDKVQFIFNKSMNESVNVYFKESHHPYWKAKIESNNKQIALPIYTAGPGFMYVQLPEVSAGDRLQLQIQYPFMHHLAYVISGTTVIGLLVYLVRPQLFSHRKIVRPIKYSLPKLEISSWMNKRIREDEENY